jgi:hypothetical protein
MSQAFTQGRFAFQVPLGRTHKILQRQAHRDDLCFAQEGGRDALERSEWSGTTSASIVRSGGASGSSARKLSVDAAKALF